MTIEREISGEQQDEDIRPEQMKPYPGKRPMYSLDGFTIHSEAAWYAPQSYKFNAGFRFQFEKAVMVSGAEDLVVYEKDGGVLRAGARDCESAGLVLPVTDTCGNEICCFADCVKRGVPADKIKPGELETALN